MILALAAAVIGLYVAGRVSRNLSSHPQNPQSPVYSKLRPPGAGEGIGTVIDKAPTPPPSTTPVQSKSVPNFGYDPIDPEGIGTIPDVAPTPMIQGEPGLQTESTYDELAPPSPAIMPIGSSFIDMTAAAKSRIRQSFASGDTRSGKKPGTGTTASPSVGP